MAGDEPASYCRRCGERLSRGAIASRQRACCLNATPIAGVCPTHGPVGPHHAVDEPGESNGERADEDLDRE
ncbi:hypothetical protein FK85_13985 [Halorubrum saccharovorum]|uniref:Uncharacterized protein n=1 Tax=Halorubrum saccharovorum TaxID=2248 RepID=A0A081EST9_9EURY|nr:hypothetical protein [Halorubrum saccharovorum]KDS90477.1 hypothetical protein FK85_13985 [Halorubrum saccharovorum]